MSENSKDYEFCIKETLNNAKKRINLLKDSDKICVLQEYKEWIKDGISNHTVLTQKYFLIFCIRRNLK